MDLFPLIPAIMVLSIPIVAIVGSFYVRLQKMKLQSGGMDYNDKKLLNELMAENAELRQRIESLEILSDPDDLNIKLLSQKNEVKQQIDFLAEEINKLKEQRKNTATD